MTAAFSSLVHPPRRGYKQLVSAVTAARGYWLGSSPISWRRARVLLSTLPTAWQWAGSAHGNATKEEVLNFQQQGKTGITSSSFRASALDPNQYPGQSNGVRCNPGLDRASARSAIHAPAVPEHELTNKRDTEPLYRSQRQLKPR